MTHRPIPQKTTDARYRSYEEKYGDESWELDALEPRVIVDLIRQSIDELLQPAEWEKAIVAEERGRQELALVAGGWDSAIRHLSQ